MPLYDYRCKDCGNEIEVMHGIDAVGPAVCDVCGGAMKKALSTPAIHFKGSGWAKKDFQTANKAKAKAAKADATDSAKSETTNKGGDGDGSTKSSTEGTDKSPAATKEPVKSPVASASTSTSKAAD